MSRKSIAIAMLIGMVAAAVACSKDEKAEGADGATGAQASAVASASALPVASAPPATAENDPLPAHSDIAKTVRQEITKQNYKSELDKLEKEIDQEL